MIRRAASLVLAVLGLGCALPTAPVETCGPTTMYLAVRGTDTVTAAATWCEHWTPVPLPARTGGGR